MRYYKIILNNNIIGAGCNFLRWMPRMRKFAYCEMEQAECVRDVVTETTYHDTWLLNVPEESGAHIPTATVVLIEQAEYDDLIEQLLDGETIPEPLSVPEQSNAFESGLIYGSDEHHMTVQEMRAKIAAIEEALDIIMGVIE